MRRLSILIGLLIASGASASGLDAPSVASAFSGPVTVDASAVYWNPGLLVRLKRPTLLVTGGLVLGHIGYTRERRGRYQFADSLELRDPVDPGYLDPSRTGEEAPVSATPFSPHGDVFFAMPVSPTVAVGLGVWAPYAAPISYPANGAQRFQLQEAFIAVSQIGGGLSVKVHQTVSVGVGVSYVSGIAALKRIQDFGALDDLGDTLAKPPVAQENSFGANAPSTVRELDVLARPFSLTDGQAHGVSFNVGVAIEPNEHTMIGLTYDHGAQMDFDAKFALNMDDEFFTQDLSPTGLTYPKLIKGTAKLSFRLPKRITLATRYQATDELLIEGRVGYITWSDIEAFKLTLKAPGLAQPKFNKPDTSSASLVRDWEDSIHIEADAHYRLSETLTLMGKLGYQSPASPDETVDAGSPDGHRLIGAFNVGWRFKPGYRLLAGSVIQGILPRTVTTSRYDAANGTYTMLIATLSAHLEVTFGEAP